MLTLTHVPQLVTSDSGNSNDTNLNDTSNDGGSVASHGGTLQSAEDCTNTEGRLSGSSNGTCQSISIGRDADLSSASYQLQVRRW